MALITRGGKGSKLTIQEMDGNLEYLRGSYKKTTSSEIDWSEASVQSYDLTGNVEFSFSGAEAGQKLKLILIQKVPAVVSWPVAVKWVNGNDAPDFDFEITDLGMDGGFVTGTGVNNQTNTIAIQPDGKILIGGEFTSYDGDSAVRIARLNSDGSLDASFVTGTGFSGGKAAVNSIAIQPDGKILVGGAFTGYDGDSVGNIARLNPDGTLDASFVTGTGFSSGTSKIVIQSDGKILVVGGFNQYDGDSVGEVARLNSDGSLDASFVTGTGFNSNVTTATIQADGKILIGGEFTSYDGDSAVRIARLNSDGSLDASFVTGTGFNGVPNSIAIQPDGKIVVGGEFTEYDGDSIVYIARLNSDGSLDASFVTGTGFDEPVQAITFQPNGKLVVGGGFTEYDGGAAARIARLNSDGSLDPNFVTGSGFDENVVTELAIQSDYRIIAGGNFTGYDGNPANGIIRLVGSQEDVYRMIDFCYTGEFFISIS
jgi:uncharacterized delta-60 repeat protein